MSADKRTNNEWEVEILAQLDQAAQEYDFPMLNHLDFQHAAIRLTAFRSSSEWLIVFQEIALFQETSFMNTISAYGNKIKKPGTQLGVDNLITAVPTQPIWSDEGDFLLDTLNFELVINGQARKFSPSAADYEKAGIDLGSDTPDPVKILRLLTVLIPEELFLPDDELLEACNRKGGGLKRFIQLDDWYHPDIADDELPSESECLRRLAAALSKNDKSLYSCPEEMLNTHWSNWEEEE